MDDGWMDGITETGNTVRSCQEAKQPIPVLSARSFWCRSVIPACLSAIAPVAHRAICALRKLSWTLAGPQLISHREGKKRCMYGWMYATGMTMTMTALGAGEIRYKGEMILYRQVKVLHTV